MIPPLVLLLSPELLAQFASEYVVTSPTCLWTLYTDRMRFGPKTYRHILFKRAQPLSVGLQTALHRSSAANCRSVLSIERALPLAHRGW